MKVRTRGLSVLSKPSTNHGCPVSSKNFVLNAKTDKQRVKNFENSTEIIADLLDNQLRSRAK